VSGDSEVPLPTGYGTFLRVDEFKAIYLADAWFLDLSRDDFSSNSWKQVSEYWFDSSVQSCIMIVVI
jgi:hypothetical protein